MDDLLDQITGGDHSRVLFQLTQVGCARRLSRGAGGGWARGEGRAAAATRSPSSRSGFLRSPFPFTRQSSVREACETVSAGRAPRVAGLRLSLSRGGGFPSVLSFALRISLSVSHSVGLLTEFARLSFV